MEGPVAPPPKLPSFKDMVKKESTGESDARVEANAKIKSYTDKYELLKVPKQESDELKKEVEQKKSKTDVLNRLAQFTNTPVSFDWFGILLDIVIAILGFVLVFQVFSRLFTSATEVVIESSDVTI